MANDNANLQKKYTIEKENSKSTYSPLSAMDIHYDPITISKYIPRFHYYKRSDRIDVTQDYTLNKVSDPSNIPYKFIVYNEINSMGRNWIRKYKFFKLFRN